LAQPPAAVAAAMASATGRDVTRVSAKDATAERTGTSNR
jgi:hypothetical protein